MYLNIITTRKILSTVCCLLFIGLLAGSVIAFGQTEPAPNSTETPLATPTLTPSATPAPTAATPLQLNISLISPAQPTMIVGILTFVTFNVNSNGKAVSDAIVTLSGSATGNGVTDWQGNTTIGVNATTAGTITATANSTNYKNGSMTLTAANPIGGDPTGFWIIIIVTLGIAIILTIFTIWRLRQEKGIEPATKESGIKASTMCSLSLLLISLAGWIWGGFLEKNSYIGVLGAGVFGGIIYDIVVNKGEYIVPKVEEDGISLGVIYGAVIGLITAIIVIDNALTHGNTNLSLIDSTTVFLGAVGVKTSSEFAATQKLMVKKRASISFNLTDGQKTIIKEGVPYRLSETKFKADGEILVNEKTLESQVVHLNLQKDGVLVKKDIITKGDSGTKFENIEISDKELDEGTWIAWASWDGNDTYDKAESRHQKFEVKS